jgi:hypothetical protein
VTSKRSRKLEFGHVGLLCSKLTTVIQLRGRYQAVVKVVVLSFHGGLLISVVDAEKAAARRRNERLVIVIRCNNNPAVL